MPLKIVTRANSEFLYIRGTVRGKGIFESTGTADPQRAEAYRVRRESQLWDEAVHGKKAVIYFSHAVKAYLEAEERTPTTKTHLSRLLLHFRTKKVSEIKQEELDGAYRAILTAGTSATAATKVRAVLTPMRALLEFSARRGWCDKPAFERPRIVQTRMSFLRPAEATALINGAADHIKPLLVFLIGTGCRMSEALELEWSNVDLRGARAVVWQKQGDERHIDLPPVTVAALSSIPEKEGRVFRPVRSRRAPGQAAGKEIGDGYMDTGRTGGGQIKNAWATACRNAGLAGHIRVWTPIGSSKELSRFVPDITPHCLRHTFATWHYCLHKDLIRLRDDGGWRTITMVTRYAKKMPESYRTDIAAWLEQTKWPLSGEP